ncbi:MAG TPA: hypothetical protein ENJ37_10545 [Deltaproteobacteria bacterium]|nr:hypothetical protein [Deltaproteobacteria bacterium]
MSRKRRQRAYTVFVLVLVLCTAWSGAAPAHHILGRPAYSLSEDSNTPPSMQVETQIGDYLVTYMVFPAFPKPGEPGRINLYASRLDNGETYDGEVTFAVRDDSWLNRFFTPDEEIIGVQKLDINVYRQGFEFRNAGDYIITARFESGGEPYIIDFPLRIGEPSRIGPVGIAVGVVAAVLAAVSIFQRKKVLGARRRQSMEERGS